MEKITGPGDFAAELYKIKNPKHNILVPYCIPGIPNFDIVEITVNQAGLVETSDAIHSTSSWETDAKINWEAPPSLHGTPLSRKKVWPFADQSHLTYIVTPSSAWRISTLGSITGV